MAQQKIGFSGSTVVSGPDLELTDQVVFLVAGSVKHVGTTDTASAGKVEVRTVKILGALKLSGKEASEAFDRIASEADGADLTLITGDGAAG